jgi:hypothetical protein
MRPPAKSFCSAVLSCGNEFVKRAIMHYMAALFLNALGNITHYGTSQNTRDTRSSSPIAAAALA